MKFTQYCVRAVAAILLLSILSPAVVSQEPAATGTPTLEDMMKAFAEARDALQEPQRELEDSYDLQLEELRKKMTASGELEKVIAVKKEIEGYKEGRSTPAGAGYPELKRLQEIYSKVSETRAAEMKRKMAGVVKIHRGRLLALQKQLTREERLEEALTVKAAIDGLPELSVEEPEAATSSGAATLEKPFENSLGMKFVPVPVTRGPTKGKQILFSIWETRVKDYDRFVTITSRQWKKPGFDQEVEHPAVWVSATDAAAFCEWLTETERKKQKIGVNDRYRLPLDHEWSCAVGIGRSEKPDLAPMEKNNGIPDVYPWGKDWPPPKEFGNYLGEETNDQPVAGRSPIMGFSDGFRNTSPAGSFAPNKLGIFDLGGNVCEWCIEGSEPPANAKFLYRDAGWRQHFPEQLLSSRRWEGAYYDHIGFRCVLEIGDPE